MNKTNNYKLTNVNKTSMQINQKHAFMMKVNHNFNFTKVSKYGDSLFSTVIYYYG